MARRGGAGAGVERHAPARHGAGCHRGQAVAFVADWKKIFPAATAGRSAAPPCSPDGNTYPGPEPHKARHGREKDTTPPSVFELATDGGRRAETREH